MSRSLSVISVLVSLVLLAAAGAVMVFAAAFLYISPKLPATDALRDVQLQTPLRIYSRDGKLLGEFGEKRRSPVSILEVPDTFIKAFLAAEDDRFYEHHGVDVNGLLRATAQLITTGSIQSGGSTITMQVAKNYFLSQERTFTRKFTEIFLAIEIERALSKGDILELYLNKIFLGNHAYGIEAAAQVYYGKPIDELNLAQMAMIAGLPKAPSAYNPVANPQRAKLRRNWILSRMRSLGYISEQGYQQAKAEAISATAHGTALDLDAGYVAEMARLEMLDRFGRSAYEDGYSVITTVDSELQRVAKQAVIEGLMEYDGRHGYRGPEQQWSLPDTVDDAARSRLSAKLEEVGRVGEWHPALVLKTEEQSLVALLATGKQTELQWQQGLEGTSRYISEDRVSYAIEKVEDILKPGDVIRLRMMGKDDERQWQFSQLPAIQGALVSLDADNGAIISLVGGYDYRKSSFNRVTQASRQPGSSFKPFLYAAALANGFTAATVINDAPIVFDDAGLGGTWRPSNDGGTFNGPTRLRKALYLSRNLVSIRLLREMGIGKAIAYIDRFGFASQELPRDLSLALGSHSMTPMTIVSGYAVLANGGYKVTPYLIDRIIDRDGNTVFRANPAVVCRSCDGNGGGPADFEEYSLDEILAEEVRPQNDAERVVDEETIFLIDSILKDAVARGTGRKARVLERSDAAGKTGTTNGPTDAWFSGYSGGVVTSTWAGFDQNQKLGRREYGGSVALPIWIDYMRAALKNRPERHLRQPESIVSVRIDPDTGMLAQPGQANAIFEYFRSDTVPQEGNYNAPGDYGSGGQEPVELF